jgi:hypothetical protein
MADAFNEFGGDIKLPPFINTLATVLGG